MIINLVKDSSLFNSFNINLTTSLLDNSSLEQILYTSPLIPLCTTKSITI